MMAKAVFSRLYGWAVFVMLAFVFSYLVSYELRSDLMVNWNYHRYGEGVGVRNNDWQNPVNIVQRVCHFFDWKLPETMDGLMFLLNGGLWTLIGWSLSLYSPALATAAYSFVLGNMDFLSPASFYNERKNGIFDFNTSQFDSRIPLLFGYIGVASFVSAHIMRLHSAIAIFWVALCIHDRELCFADFGGFMSELFFGAASRSDGEYEPLVIDNDTFLFWLRLCLCIGYGSMIFHDMFVHLFMGVFVELVHMSWIILTSMVIVETFFKQLLNNTDTENIDSIMSRNNNGWDYAMTVGIPVFSIAFGLSAVLLRILISDTNIVSVNTKNYSKGNIIMRVFGCGVGVLLGMLLWKAYTNPEVTDLNSLYPSLFVLAVASMYIQVSFFTDSTKSSYVKVKMCRSEDYLTMTYVTEPSHAKLKIAGAGKSMSAETDSSDLKASVTSASPLLGKNNKEEDKTRTEKSEPTSKSYGLHLKMKYNDTRVNTLDEDLATAQQKYKRLCQVIKYNHERTEKRNGAQDKDKDKDSDLRDRLEICNTKRDLAIAAADVTTKSEALAQLIREIEVEVQVEKDCLKQVKQDLQVALSHRKSQVRDGAELVKSAITTAIDSYTNIRQDMGQAEDNVERATQVLKFRSNDCIMEIEKGKELAKELGNSAALEELQQIEQTITSNLSDVSHYGVSEGLKKTNSMLSIDLGEKKVTTGGDKDPERTPDKVSLKTMKIVEGKNGQSFKLYESAKSTHVQNSPDSLDSGTSPSKTSKWFWSRHRRAKLTKNESFDSVDSELSTGGNSPSKRSSFFLRRKR